MAKKKKKSFNVKTILGIVLSLFTACIALVLANGQYTTLPSFTFAAATTVSSTEDFLTVLAASRPGDTIVINGTITGGIKINKSGTENNRITIKGGTITGGSGRLVELRDSNYLVFDGVTFDASTADSALYMLHSQYNTFVNSTFKNAGGECVRLKIQSNNNSFLQNRIENCGRRNFNPPSSKNGEGIYIGTAPEQLSKNATEGYTSDPDNTQYNLIKGNTIITNANECVDIKESAIFNLVENNTCSQQMDDSSGAFDSRGEQNIFRNNVIQGTVKGAGVRLGGDTSSHGIQNCVLNNTMTAYGSVGAIKIMTSPQKALCGNTTYNTQYGNGTFRADVSITAACTATQIENCLAGKTFGSGYETIEPNIPTPQPTTISTTLPPVPSTSPIPTRTPSPSSKPSPTASTRPTYTPIPSPLTKQKLPVLSVSASSDDGNIAQNVLDNNYGTRWSANGKKEWISFDLGQTYHVTHVAISFYRGNKRRAQFDVEASTDGQTWKRIYRGQSSGKSTSMQEFDISDQDARYLRIINRGNNENDWGSYKEVIWYGR